MHEKYRGLGIGVSLMHAAHTQMAQHDMCSSVGLRCRAGNEPALALYTGRHMKYRIVSKERDYYTGPIEDAYLLEKSLT